MTRTNRKTRHFLSLLAPLLLIAPLGCGEDPVDLQPDPDVSSVTVSFDGAVLEALGATTQMAAEVRDLDGNVVTVTLDWRSSDPAVVRVSSTGLVTALANGESTITAMAAGVSGTASVTVNQTLHAVVVATPRSTLTAIEEGYRLTAIAADANGNAMPSAAPTWTSSDPLVLSVTGEGFIEAESNGSATVSASIEGITGTADITVLQVPTAIVLTPVADTLRFSGDAVQLTADIVDANGHTVVGASGTWTSSDASVATVTASGLVSAVSDGVTQVTLSVGSLTESASITVSFDDVSATVTIALSTATVFAEGGFLATATVVNRDGVELTGLTLRWTASDPSVRVATVQLDALGRSTALLHTGGTTGTFTVRAETDTGVTGDTPFTVVTAPQARGVAIDFETEASGAPTCRGSVRCPIGREYGAWGVMFRWVDASAGGGLGLPTIDGTPGAKYLANDRQNRGPYLTGSHEMTFSVDISTMDLRINNPAAIAEATITVYDALQNEIVGAVIVRTETISGWARIQEVTIHAPVLIGRIKVGPVGGVVFLDDLVY